MSFDDPIRLRDTLSSELVDLRDAIREAGALTPSGAAQARLREGLHSALGETAPPDPPDPELAEDLEGRQRDAFEPENDPHRLDTMISEAAYGSRAQEALEAEVAGDLAAGLLVAGAAIVWLARRTTPPPDDDES